MRPEIAALARSADGVDFTSVTDAEQTGPAQWVDVGVLEIPFDRDLTPAETDAVVLLLTSASTAEADLRKTCTDYLALAAPTTAQNAAQIKALTRLALAAFEARPR